MRLVASHKKEKKKEKKRKGKSQKCYCCFFTVMVIPIPKKEEKIHNKKRWIWLMRVYSPKICNQFLTNVKFCNITLHNHHKHCCHLGFKRGSKNNSLLSFTHSTPNNFTFFDSSANTIHTFWWTWHVHDTDIVTAHKTFSLFH